MTDDTKPESERRVKKLTINTWPERGFGFVITTETIAMLFWKWEIVFWEKL